MVMENDEGTFIKKEPQEVYLVGASLSDQGDGSPIPYMI